MLTNVNGANFVVDYTQTDITTSESEVDKNRRSEVEEAATLTKSQINLIKAIVNELLDEKLRALPTKADIEELAKADDIGAIVKVLEHHNLIVKAD